MTHSNCADSGTTGAELLIVEDESKLSEILRDYLTADGYQVTVLADGRDVEPWVRAHDPALILLDLMLPGLDGLSICRALRQFSAVPIVMTTARIDEIDRLVGLELGADDYICKPYSPREVVARVKAVLRRAAAPQDAHENSAAGDADSLLSLEADRLRVSAGQRSVSLTAVEFALLDTLHRSPGRIHSRDSLMDHIYSDRRVVSDRTIDSHIKKLRRKLGELALGRELIHSVYGVGYRYEDGPNE